MASRRHPGSASIKRLKFGKIDRQYGFGGVSDWATSHGGRDYKLVKSKGEWWLCYRSTTPGSPTWELARTTSATAGLQSLGTRLDDAKHNATIFLCLGQGPDHENWRD